MSTPIFTLSAEMQETWDDIMIQMEAFVNDTNADVDMAYDWVCEMLDIDSFVDNEIAWNSFYNCWESCDNRNDRPFFHEYNFAWLCLQHLARNVQTLIFSQSTWNSFFLLSSAHCSGITMMPESSLLTFLLRRQKLSNPNLNHLLKSPFN